MSRIGGVVAGWGGSKNEETPAATMGLPVTLSFTVMYSTGPGPGRPPSRRKVIDHLLEDPVQDRLRPQPVDHRPDILVPGAMHQAGEVMGAYIQGTLVVRHGGIFAHRGCPFLPVQSKSGARSSVDRAAAF